MPRYFFDITEAGDLTRDEHGDECADDDEAKDFAIGLLPVLARHMLPGRDQHEFIAKARNEAGEIVYEASLTLTGRWWPGRR